MKVLIDDQIKIHPHRKNTLWFGSIDGVGRLLKQRGTILEADFQKQIGQWTYFVQFGDTQDPEQRYWFAEDEIYLI